MQFRIDWLTAAQLHDAEIATLPVIRFFLLLEPAGIFEKRPFSISFYGHPISKQQMSQRILITLDGPS